MSATARSLRALIDQGRTFRCIYADPPWRYRNRASRGAAENHYPTMSLEEIAALPVVHLAAGAAHLFLWTTNAFLFHAFPIMRAWGFEFRDTFVWCKPQMGMGNYFRCSHEFLLLGVRGEHPFLMNGEPSYGIYNRRGHSEKPEEVRAMIERVSPGPRLELFARRHAPGWTVWGNDPAVRGTATHSGGSDLMTDYPFHPLAEQYPLMADDQLAELAEAMKAHGFLPDRPIVLHEGKILAGRDRYRAARLAGVEPVFIDLPAGVAPEDYVVMENEYRKHLDAEFLKARRERRIARVAELRQQGKSLRTIGEELGIDQKQVQRDLNATADSVRSEIPDRVVGRDGRSQPAQREKPTEPKEKGEPKPNGSKPGPKQIVVPEGAPPDFRSLIRHLQRLTEEAFALLTSTSSASWSNEAKAAYLMEVMKFIEKFKADKAKPNGKKKGKPGPKPIVVPEGAPPDFPSLIRQLQRLTRDAFASLASTSSAGWSKEAQAAYLMEVAKIIEKFEADEADEQTQASPRPGEIKPLGVGIDRANEAINSLKRIPKNDALRQRAFQIVSDWMRHNQ